MTASEGKDAGAATGGRCPICGAPTQHAVRPFCSRRCADVDLGRWLSGGYIIGGAGGADADEDGDQARAGEMAGLDRASGGDDVEEER